MMFLRLAWRNLWRNKRRTLITIASIFFAVLLAVVMRSAQLGAYDNMIKNMVGFYTGYIQIHKAGYWEEQTIDNSFTFSDTLKQKLEQSNSITHFVPRMESFALASSGEKTKGAMVVGIDPEAEHKVTHVKDKLKKGEYLQSRNQQGALVASELAEQLNLGVNDTLVMIGQGYHGVSAAGKYVVTGILEFGSPELNRSLVYLPIETAQYMYGATNLITSVVVMIDDPSDAEKVTNRLKENIDPERYEVMSWKTMMPELVQLIEADSAGGIIMITILYIVIAFGIFGTLLMMTTERMHEFGILIAIGMKNYKLAWTVFLETVILAIAGVILGVAGSIPVVTYFYHNPIRLSGNIAEVSREYGMEPIMPFSLDTVIFTSQAWAVIIMVLILTLYPTIKIMSLRAIEALRS